MDAISKWLSGRKDKLVDTLRRTYRYKLDYIITKPDKLTKLHARANNRKLYLLTPDCFKRLAMMSRSKNAEMIRSYFIEIEGEQTLEGMRRDIENLERNQRN